MNLKVIKYDDLGNGIAKIDNKVCFVEKAMPNELVNVKVIKDNKKYSVGLINSVIESNPYRIESICRYYNKCGGCNFLHMDLEEEKRFKVDRTINYFNKIDFFYSTLSSSYRNKITLHVKNGEIGLYNTKSNDLVIINYCYLCKDRINDVINIIKEKKDIDFNGSIIIRVNSNNEVILVINGKYKYIDYIKEKDIINNIIYNSKVIKGKDYFIEEISSYKFKVNYNSFFQVNILGLEKIIEILNNFLVNKKINIALDLYSGTSVLGIIISKYVNKVISIESNSYATNDARENIKLNNVDNLEIINGLVEDNIEKFKDIDLVIVDPARNGLDKKTINYLNNLNSKYIIYIACGIDSLKRDIKLLTNYNINNIYAIDMFPRTRHCESIVLLELK